MVTFRKTVLVAVCAVFAAALLGVCVLLLFLPFPQETGATAEEYECVWENGDVSEESYASAYSSLKAAEKERILLERDGMYGEIPTGDEYRRAYGTLSEGSLAELLALQTVTETRLERAALWRAFSGYLWYEGESFAWNGERVTRTDASSASVVVLLGGKLPSGYLAAAGARTLLLRAEGEISASDFVGTSVEAVGAQFPYRFSEGALYLDTPGGTRLVAALPYVTDLVVENGVVFADEGALSPCTALRTLRIPFVGSAENPLGTAYVGYFGYVFGEDETGRYAVPETLERVTVTGGTIGNHAFYLCHSLREIDAGSVPAERVEEDAFLDCTSLCYLRTSANVNLPGEFLSETDGEGCTVYTR